MTITLEQLEVLTPAAFSDTAADHVSKRYNHVRTADVVEHLLDAGFEITHATQQKTQKRSEHKASNQKHRIRMRMLSQTASTKGCRPNPLPCKELWRLAGGGPAAVSPLTTSTYDD